MRVLLRCHCRHVGSQRVFVSAPFVGSSELLHAHMWIKADMCERVALCKRTCLAFEASKKHPQ